MPSMMDYDFGKAGDLNRFLLIGIAFIGLYIGVVYASPRWATSGLVWLVVIGGLLLWLGGARQKSGKVW